MPKSRRRVKTKAKDALLYVLTLHLESAKAIQAVNPSHFYGNRTYLFSFTFQISVSYSFTFTYILVLTFLIISLWLLTHVEHFNILIQGEERALVSIRQTGNDSHHILGVIRARAVSVSE